MINRAKHGVPLAFGARIFADAGVLRIPSPRPEDGEVRWKAVGMVDDRLWTAVFVERANTTKFISVRRSNDAEARGYHRNPR
ncbi:BrnT family toxin [Sphingomonas sp. CV7422]|uniref:BrnT family toxin n=1 Tax=Sphingomonas sp. CV7422 TaxID=3018036 RepID=UPI0022FE8174|nr:BrnT family toxin [Sphingomonas sp. CV7422]